MLGRAVAPFLAAACVAACGEDPGTRRASAARPNVVLISIDTCRADHLGVYGDPRGTTPRIDALAAEGATFAMARSTNPTTLPAHSSLLTGTIPPVHGVRNNESYKLDDASLTLAEVLRGQGYHTAAFVGAFPLAARFGLGQGFELYDDAFLGAAGRGLFDERRAEEVSRAAVTWLERQRDGPFFLFLHYFDPHAPYAPPEPFASTWRDDPYAGEIAYSDRWIGHVVEALQRLGVWESTVLVVTADHGESRGEHGEQTHGFFVYDSTIRVPLVLKAPGIARGVVHEDPVGLIDVMPTILGAAGVEAPPGLQGIDLRPRLARGAPAADPRALYSESFLATSFGCSPLRSLSRERWKYVWTVEPELYDVLGDPREADNRAASEREVAGELHERLQALLAESAPVHAPGASDQDVERLERLEALGYVGGGTVEDAFALDPAMADAKSFIGTYQRIMEAEASYAGGRLDEARAACSALLATRPDLMRVHALLGRIAVDQGRPAQAITHFGDALRIAEQQAREAVHGLYPDLDYHAAVTHLNLARVYLQQRAAEQAAEHAAVAVQLMPSYAEAHVLLGELLEQRGELEQAAAHFEQALSAAEDDARAQFGLGVVRGRQGDAAEAERRFARTVEIDPGHAAAHNNLGILLAGRGELESAREHFAGAVRAEPGFAAAHNNLGSVLLRLGQPDLARGHFEQALQLRPGFAAAAQNLAEAEAALRGR